MRLSRLAAALALTLVAPAALAFGPHDHAGFVSRAMDTRVVAPVAWSAPARASAAFDRFVAATGAWQVTWDADTGVPVRMWGAGIATPGAQRDPAIAEAAARAFLTAHLDLFAPGSSAADLELVGNKEVQGLRTVTFAQRWNGLRVVGGTMSVMFKRDRLFVAGSTALPDVTASLPSPAAAPPSTNRARTWLAAETGVEVEVTETGAAAVFPEVRIDGQIRFTVARPVALDARSEIGKWLVWIDAATGEPLARVSRLLWDSGTLTYNTPERNMVSPRIEVPAGYAAITVDGQSATTGHAGQVTWPGAAAATIVPGLTGPHITVVDGGGHQLATGSLPISPGGMVSWNQSTDEFADAQVTVFAHGNFVKQLIRHHMNPHLPWVDGQMVISVNEQQLCNAFADLDPDMVHFFNYGTFDGSTFCDNTGRMPDVVYHETGHNLHFRSLIDSGLIATYNDFFTNDIPGLSEGLGDTLGTAITGDPIIGPGFFVGDPNGIRTLDPIGFEKVYPNDITGEPHADGEIIGGAIWDLRKALIEGLGEGPGQIAADRAAYGVISHSVLFTATYTDAIAADDDDGNLANGTPHQCEISRAFLAHGLAPALAGGVTIGTPTTDATTISVPIATPAADCPGLTVTAVNVTWTVRGDAAQTGTIPLTAGAAWTGPLPALVEGSVMQYQVVVTFSDSTTTTRPLDLTDPGYEAYIGPSTVLFCDDFETDKGWTHSPVEGFDQWERGPGGVAPAAGDSTAAASGTTVLGTDLTDNGLYPSNSDTRVESPAIDTTGYATVRLQYKRWLDVDGGDAATISAGGVEVWRNAAEKTSGDGEWRFHDVDLTATATSGAINVRYGLADNGDAIVRGGWNLDDVCVVGIGTTCGDGLIRGTETCDDLNTEDGDGCSALCAMEPPDEGGCCSTGTDPEGALVVTGFGALGLLVVLRRRRRRA